MRLFTCLILFVLFYSCAPNNSTIEPEKDLPYRIEWLGDNHVKVHFDTLTALPNGECHPQFVKSYEIQNDSSWLEIKKYDYDTKNYEWTKSNKLPFFLAEKNKTNKDTSIVIIDSCRYSQKWKTIKDDFSTLSTENKLHLDSFFITAGSCSSGATLFSYKNDSIFITKTRKQITVNEWCLLVPDSTKFNGAVSDSLLFRLHTMIDSTELTPTLLSYSTHSAGHKIRIFTNGKEYKFSGTNFSSGLYKLINLAWTIKQEDLE